MGICAGHFVGAVCGAGISLAGLGYFALLWMMGCFGYTGAFDLVWCVYCMGLRFVSGGVGGAGRRAPFLPSLGFSLSTLGCSATHAATTYNVFILDV